MTIKGDYEKSGWNFDDIGGRVIVAWKNVGLKNGKPGCVTVRSDLIVIHGQTCVSYEAFIEMIFNEKNILGSYEILKEEDSELIASFLHGVLTEACAKEVSADIDGIRRHNLAR